MTESDPSPAGAVRTRRGRPATYPWATTDVGASFAIERGVVGPGTPTRLVYRQNRMERVRGTGRVWRLELDAQGGWLVWRIQ